MSKGGIFIPDTFREKPRKGEIMAIGNGLKKDNLILSVGDRVIFEKSGASEMEIDGEIYLKMGYNCISFKL